MISVIENGISFVGNETKCDFLLIEDLVVFVVFSNQVSRDFDSSIEWR